MKRKGIVLSAFIVSLAMTGVAQSLSFKVAGVTRNYLMHAPSSGLSNPALVIMLHGHGMDAASQESGSKWYTIADREKFIVAYPNAISQNWDVSATSNDLTFILAIIDTLDAKYHIDRNRVYVAGFSQGAAMCHMCGCAHSEVFAAMAPASGGLGGTCKLSRPVPLYMTFGTKDMSPTSTFMSSVTKWVQMDSCASAPKLVHPYPATNSQSKVFRLTYSPCAQGAEVIADSILDGPHEWPMNTQTEVNNTEESWAFFKRFSLKGSTAVRQPTFSIAHANVAATYNSGIVRVHDAGEQCRVRIIDPHGRLLAAAPAVHGIFAFKDRPRGVYLLKVNGDDWSASLRIVIP